MFNNTESGKLNVYLAGPLFSAAERMFNTELKRMLSPFLEVYLPQEDGGLLVDMVEHGVPVEKASSFVFSVDMRAMEMCDLFLIILDGRSIDEGAAFELGYAYAKGKPCYGLKTDPRQLFLYGDNPMINGPLQAIFTSIDDLISWAEEYCVRSRRNNSVCSTHEAMPSF